MKNCQRNRYMMIEGIPHPRPHTPNSPVLGRDFPEQGRVGSPALKHRKKAFKLEGLNLTTKKQGTAGILPRTGRSVSTTADIPPNTLLAGGDQGDLHCLHSPGTLTVQTRAGRSEHTSSWCDRAPGPQSHPNTHVRDPALPPRRCLAWHSHRFTLPVPLPSPAALLVQPEPVPNQETSALYPSTPPGTPITMAPGGSHPEDP